MGRVSQKLMIQSPFNDFVTFCCLEDPNPQVDLLTPLELEIANNFKNIQRRHDFTRGRLAAHLALKQLGQPLTNIGRGANGEPCWPHGIIGSISHAGTLAAAAVASPTMLVALGIDLEQRARSLTLNIAPRIAGPEEQAWIKAESHLQHERTLLVFSAKESCFKAFFHATQIKLKFDDVRLSWDEELHYFKACLTHSINFKYKKGYAFMVKVALNQHLIVTGVELPVVNILKKSS